ncbi:MAG: glycosyltransferase [Candidatus Sumerlaeia bacterium]|nr:glycosyltransferase [Candidatus Sumerlaeia bacterium]
MTARPRVLHVYKDYWPPVVGGVEKTIHRLCHGLQGDFDPQVLVVNDGPETVHEIIEGIPVTKAACRRRLASAPLSRALIQEIIRAEAEILHFHHPMPTAEIGLLRRRAPARVVVTWHSDIVRQWWALWAYGPFLRAFLRRADAVMPTSPNYIESSKWLRRVRRKCFPVPLGVEPEAFDLTPEDQRRVEAVRARWGPRPMILFVGRFRAYKGLPFLLAAMKRLPSAQCLLIGDGPMRAKAESLVRALGVADRVQLLGELNDRDVLLHLHACDMLCLPSHQRSEAFGLVQVEAMMCGKPVVSTALATGVPFVNLHGETGLVAKPGDWRSLAECLNTLIESKSRRDLMGRQARARALREFTAGKMCERVAMVYRTVLGRRG